MGKITDFLSQGSLQRKPRGLYIQAAIYIVPQGWDTDNKTFMFKTEVTSVGFQ